MINQVDLIDLQLKIAKARDNFNPQVEVSTLFLERIIKRLGELSSKPLPEKEVPYIALHWELNIEEEIERLNAHTTEYVKGFVMGHNLSLDEARKNIERAGYGVMHWAKPRSSHDTAN